MALAKAVTFLDDDADSPLMLVIVVIVDLDRPRRSMIKVNQEPMIQLQASLIDDVLQ